MQLKKLEVYWFQFSKCMVKGGWESRNDSIVHNNEESDLEYSYSNNNLKKIVNTEPLRKYIGKQYLMYIRNVCRAENISITTSSCLLKPQNHIRDPQIKV